MLRSTYEQRRACEALERPALEALQLAKLNALCARILPANHFYAHRLGQSSSPLQSLDDLRQVPFTTKAELVGDGEYAANLTFPLHHFVRFHRTSGTQGRPLVVLDTREDWQWWVDTWQFVLDAAELTPQDRVLLAFSFGPFIGFWSACDAAIERGALVIPGGGLSSLARLDLMLAHRVTALFCTPSYALRLVEVAEQHQMDPASIGLKRMIVAGEPGGSSPPIRDRLEAAWQAGVIDHAGASEVGPWGYADESRRGLRIVETEFIAEFESLERRAPAHEGEPSELILTSLGREGMPAIRYRTGDVVRPSWPTGEANKFVLLLEGVLGRVDDMLIIRGVNVFPSSVERILRSFPEIAEYRLTARKEGALDSLAIEIEDTLNAPSRVAQELQLRLGLRVDVSAVPPGTLPRFEGKARRFVDNRK